MLNILIIAPEIFPPWNIFGLFSCLRVFIRLGYHFVAIDRTARQINLIGNTFWILNCLISESLKHHRGGEPCCSLSFQHYSCRKDSYFVSYFLDSVIIQPETNFPYFKKQIMTLRGQIHFWVIFDVSLPIEILSLRHIIQSLEVLKSLWNLSWMLSSLKILILEDLVINLNKLLLLFRKN